MEVAVSHSRFLEISVCAEYDKLLKNCQQAFEALHSRREEVNRAQLTGIEVGRELLSLQAHFAKSYSLLRQHAKSCPRCRLFLPSRGRSSSRQSNAIFLDGIPA
jgi:hypothetical protein